MGLIQSRFRPLPGLGNAHLQTITPTYVRNRGARDVKMHRLELPDGDFLDLALRDGKKISPKSPMVLFIHGLEGGLQSHYSLPLIRALNRKGFRVCFMHMRGRTEPNRQFAGYHAGKTEDVEAVVRFLCQQYPMAPLAAVGISLGGNMLIKHLAEQGQKSPIQAAVTVSVPFDLADCSATLNKGFAQRYQNHLMTSLLGSLQTKIALMPPPISMPNLDNIHTLYEYDNQIVAPMHGFTGADDYYRRCSSKNFLSRIRIPSRLLHAMDDPFMSTQSIPNPSHLPDCVDLELSDKGGHVGFLGTNWWLDKRIPQVLNELLNTH